jgi:hypothetical protein
MTLTIDLVPQTEDWIIAKAQQLGVEPADLARRILDERAATEPVAAPSAPLVDAENAAAMAMLEQWMIEDATVDPDEIRAAEEDLAEFKRNLNANRAATGERLVFP